MVWYCTKHKRHSIDDVCYQCDEDAMQPQLDAWLAGWDARHNTPNSLATDELREQQYSDYKSSLRHGQLKGTHDS